MKQATLETDEKFNGVELRLQDQERDFIEALNRVKQELIVALQQKPEFSDLETMAHKINTKADFQKV